jgi:hypothetical protein
MNTEEKRAALEAAGKKVRKNATAETIDEMFDELQAEQLIAEEGIEDVPKNPPPQNSKRIYGTAFWEENLLRLQTNHQTENTPAFIDWCRENMTREEFTICYPDL